jgi:hypothetical protein
MGPRGETTIQDFNRRYRGVLWEHIDQRAGHLLLMIDATKELKAWNAIPGRSDWATVERFAFPNSEEREKAIAVQGYRERVEGCLRNELLEAIKARMS